MINPEAQVILLLFIKIRFKPAGADKVKGFDGPKIGHYGLLINRGLHDLSKGADELDKIKKNGG